jgi:hypothetical protein
MFSCSLWPACLCAASMIHPPCRQSPCVCTTGPSRARYVLRTVDCQTPSLGRRAWRAVCSSQVRSLEPCAREPTSPTYIDGTQARRHPSLACEGLPCLPYDMPHMMYVRRQNADAKARRCIPTDLEPGFLHFSAEEQPYSASHLLLLLCRACRLGLLAV